MNFNILVTVFFLFILASCDSTGNKKNTTSYSYTCLDSAISGSKLNKTLEKTGNIIRNITVDEKSITDELQNEYGEAFHKDVIETKTFKLLNNPRINADLKQAMNDLLQVRENPSKITYHIYAIDDTLVNAFTFGGRIYVTTGMYNRCKGKTPLLYSIIGHEIGHSEMGHIKKVIQEMMVANKIFGEENGSTVFQVTRLLTGTFNQRNELEADYYGTDLTYALNQDICAAVKFWTEMSSNENSYNRFEDFFRSHPFSSLRAECLQSHIRKNFNVSCTPATTPGTSNDW